MYLKHSEFSKTNAGQAHRKYLTVNSIICKIKSYNIILHIFNNIILYL